MPEIMSIISGAIETAKKLRDIAKKIDDADTRNLIADLNLELSDLKDEIVRLRDENRDLRGRIEKADEIEEIRAKLELRGDLLWFKEPHKSRPEGPYCPKCLDDKEKLMLVVSAPRPIANALKMPYFCNKCKSSYKGA